MAKCYARYAKGCIYEESVKIPLVIMNKEYIKPRETCSELVESIDLFPTILELAGIKFPDNMRCVAKGKSLVNLLKGGECWHKDAVFSQLEDWIMVRTKRWKLGYGYPQKTKVDLPVKNSNRGILFDMLNDPDERHNLFYKDEYQDTVNILIRMLLDFYVDKKMPLHKLLPEIAFENMQHPYCMHIT